MQKESRSSDASRDCRKLQRFVEVGLFVISITAIFAFSDSTVRERLVAPSCTSIDSIATDLGQIDFEHLLGSFLQIWGYQNLCCS